MIMLRHSLDSQMPGTSGTQGASGFALINENPPSIRSRFGSNSNDTGYFIYGSSKSSSLHTIPENIGQFKVWERSFPVKPSTEINEAKDDRQMEWISDNVFNHPTLHADKTVLSKPLTYFLTRKQAQTLCTMIPDAVLHKADPLKKDLINFAGVLLFADVSGFTSLCEKYSNTGKGGTYRLSATMNAYIGAMVEVIYAFGGDVLKFSGDSFLAMWQLEGSEMINTAIHNVIKCGLRIQSSLGSYKTDVKVCLRVKLAISAGNLTFSVIGDDVSRCYVCVGTPVQDVKSAERTCTSGDVVLSPSAWSHCSSKNYDYSLKDDFHIKVSQILGEPSQSKIQTSVQKRNSINYPSSNNLGTNELTKKTQLRRGYFKSIEPQQKTESSTLNFKRKSISESRLCELGLIIRPFMVPPVVQQVDADQPLEFLSEMRQVTTMFINIIPHSLSAHMLIAMVDEAYCTVSRLMCKYSGCLNKVTLFDKDVTLLCVFGLRGYKHDLACQSALICALKVQQAVEGLTGTRHVSIGLATGMAYCGVVGHPLRREYTVIGGSVNKAARLMCVFPKKVTCDQVTFQRSKLPADDFVLQEPRDLKGIDTVGPIYEYSKYQAADEESNFHLPLLGREEEVKTFLTLLEQISEPVLKYGGLLVRGESRIGKSRLLDEFIALAKMKDWTTLLISLDSFHSSTPFSGAYLVAKEFLGLKENSTMREREEKLFATLGAAKMDSLCFLNDVMQVQFPNSLQYLATSMHSRKERALVFFQDIIKQAPAKLLVCVDDAQYMDAESWQLLKPSLYDDRTMLVLAMSEDEPLTPAAGEIIKNELIQHLTLEGLHQSCAVPLACQILQVEAVSTVIKDLLQSRSNGNPGWCESFLLSLLQNGGLKKIASSYKDARVRSLVVPERRLTVPSRSGIEVTNVKDSKGKTQSRNSVTACVIAPNYSITKQLLPLNIDAIIMQTFDHLPPYEQMLLKCASTLGEKFPREMLTAVLPNPVLSEIACAVLHLFEMRIFVCSAEKRSGSSTRLSRSNRSSLVGIDATVECYCQGLGNNEELLSNWKILPKYALCSKLGFAFPTFRDTIYELLLDNQKVEFHSRAVEFLEGQFQRCASCGGGGFAINASLQLNETQEEIQSSSVVSTQVLKDTPSGDLAVPVTTLSDQSVSNKVTNTATDQEDDSPATIEADGVHSSKGQYKSLNVNSESKERNNTSTVTLITTDKRRRSSLLSRIFFREPKAKKQFSFQSIGATFSDADFRYCECPLVLSEMYSQIIEHCSAAGLVTKQIRFLIEYGAASNLLGKNTLAVQSLLEVKTLTQNNASSLSEKIGPLSKLNLSLAKIYSLLGKSYLDMGSCKKSKRYLFMALDKYGYPFHQRNQALQLHFQNLAQFFQQTFSGLFIGKVDTANAELYEEVTSTMALLCNAFMANQEWDLARLAALRCLNLAQRSCSNLPNLCAAYSNLMDVCHHYGQHDYCRKLEEFSLRNCQDYYHIQVAEDLLALGRLYCATFMSRLQRGEISSAVKIGFRILQISSRVYASNVKLFVLPLLVQALLLNGRVNEAVDLMRELEFCAGSDQDQSSTAWFHALCLDLLLDAGVALEPSQSCFTFARAMANNSFIIRNVDVKKRIGVSSWLWHIRRGEWLLAKECFKLAQPYLTDTVDTSFSGLVTSLKLLECLLLTMVMSVGKDEPAQVEVYRRNIVEPLLSELRVQAKWAKVIHPRYFHLKAYSSMTKRHKSRAFQFLRKAKQMSVLHGNLMEEAWINHSAAVWSGQVNKIDQDFWVTHSTSKDHIDCHEILLHDWTKIMFTLPVENR